MSHDTKQAVVDALKQDVERAAGVLFVDFTGLTVAEANAFRGKLRASDVGYQVVKNTLMARVVAGTAYEDAVGFLKGTPTGVVMGFSDPVTAAKLTYEFAKDCEHIKVKGGIVEQKVVGREETENLAKMPSRRELQATVVSLALGPAGRLIGQIKGPAGRVVGAIDAKAESEGK